MATYSLQTGRHPRKLCPVFFPLDAEAAAPAAVSVAGVTAPVQVTRRDGRMEAAFLLPEAAAGAEIALAPAADAPATPGVQLREAGPGLVEIAVGGEPFTAYHFEEEANRPYLYPVVGPHGAQITRNYPMVPDVEGESRDHPHHKSIWTANGDVNGFDDWHDGPQKARMVHRAFTVLESGPVFGRIVEELDWLAPDGRKLLSEVRDIRIYNTPREHRLLDWEITLHADAGPVRLGDTKEGGMLSVRVATSMDGARGGIIENAWGGIGEAECWGKPSPWCDYSGEVEGAHVGIAVFDAMSNPRYPSTWHVRDYGLMGANIFGQRAFHGGNPAVCGDLVMQAGSSLCFKYRVFLHPGRATEADVAGRYLDYAFPPRVRPSEG